MKQLAPRFISRIPKDLFSAKPLFYVAEKFSYRLTSVGMNGDNDSGSALDAAGDDTRDDLTVRVRDR